MSLGVIISIAIVVLVLLWVIGLYNKIKRLQITITEAWSGIDVQIKRKANILPNLVDTIRMQMKFEEDVLSKLTAARTGLNSSSRDEVIKANEQLNALMPSIRATAEAYPALGTNASFLQMMGDIRDCEDKITYARTRYNMTVSRYNMDIQQIPANIVASQMRLQQEPMFEISEAARQDADNIRISKI